MIKKKNFTLVPNSIIYDPKISAAEFRVYVALLSFAYGNNPSYPSQKVVGNKIGLCERSVREHIKSLTDKGYISSKRRGFNKSKVYTFLYGQEENFLTERNKTSSITGSRVPDNNTINNTNNNDLETSQKGMESIREYLKKKGLNPK